MFIDLLQHMAGWQNLKHTQCHGCKGRGLFRACACTKSDGGLASMRWSALPNQSRYWLMRKLMTNQKALALAQTIATRHAFQPEHGLRLLLHAVRLPVHKSDRVFCGCTRQERNACIAVFPAAAQGVRGIHCSLANPGPPDRAL